MMRITRKSTISGKKHIMDLDVTQEQLENWQAGTLIQNAMPQLSATEREFLINGMSPEEQKEFYGEEDA